MFDPEVLTGLGLWGLFVSAGLVHLDPVRVALFITLGKAGRYAVVAWTVLQLT